MIKKIFALLLALSPFVASAQLAVGDWNIYKPFSTMTRYNNNIWKERFSGYNIQSTPEKVYYRINGSLLSYDKNTEENYIYSSRNKLNDNFVSGIWYNPEGKYLFIGYETGNIDIMYDNGEVVNLSDIKDAILAKSKDIHDVVFDGDHAYVATSFGIVKYNIPKRYVVESGIYNEDVYISSITLIDGKLVVAINYNPNEIRWLDPATTRINSWSNFKYIDSIYGNSLKSLGGRAALARLPYMDPVKGQIYIPYYCTFNFEANSCSKRMLVQDGIDYFQFDKDGRCYAMNYDGDKIYYFNQDGTFETVDVPANIQNSAITYWDSLKNLWVADDGIAEFDITTTPPTMKHDYIKPMAPTVRKAWKMKNTPSGKLLLQDLGVSSVFHGSGFGIDNKAVEKGRINLYSNGVFEDVNPKPLNNKYNAMGKAEHNNSDEFYDVLDVTEDGGDPNTLWVSVFWAGLYRVQKDDQGKWHDTYLFNPSNAPILNNGDWGKPSGSIAFDKHNNLWMAQAINSSPNVNKPTLMMLPAEKRMSNNVTKADWVPVVITPWSSNFDPEILVCKVNPDFMIINDCAWPGNIIVYDTKGTTTTADDEWNVINKFIDQDGKTFTQQTIYCMTEDKNGKIWLGTHTGILEISNVREALNPNVTVNRLKVPRKDGSGFADYLLDAQEIYSIAVDGANNKWVGTKASGIYYVSANGDEVFDNFTSENSYLLDNLVYEVVCDPNSSSVFASTPYGLVEYSSTVAPSADDYSEVYAYPNPVRPDYTGWITIKGLMDNSRVKIADAFGNVFYDTVSEGGMVIWDGCNNDGQRVKSGVYYVFASKSGETESTRGAVTKILVIN